MKKSLYNRLQKYRFRKYSSSFVRFYRQEKNRLKEIFPGAKIEHIGSTAVPHMSGKGIVDIMIAVHPSQVNKIKSALEKKGYYFKHERKRRLFFWRDIKRKILRRVHLHVTTVDSTAWKQAILTRNLLKNSATLRKKYARVKQQAVKKARGKGKAYRSYKKAFLDSLNSSANKLRAV